MILSNLKVRAKLQILMAFGAAGLMVFAGIVYWGLGKIRIGGPLYGEIVLGKDLVADILPPPAYIIESYLTGFQLAVAPPDAVPGLVAKLESLEKDFRTRHAFWTGQLAQGEMRKTFLTGSAEPGLRFFEKMKNNFVPLIRAANQKEAFQLLTGDIAKEYESHRVAIDKVVEMANRSSQ